MMTRHVMNGLAVIGLAAWLPVGSVVAAEPQPERPAIELGAPFADHAVLQRDMEVPVWGWSAPGTTVTVTFAGQTQSAVAGSDGKWMLTLKPLKTSAEPQEMLIRDDKGHTRVLRNILVGEVWMASGQSNMQWNAAKCNAAVLIKLIEEDVAAGKTPPPIREFQVTSVYASLHPIEHATGSWNDGDFGTYSAIAFAFAHKLYEELGVPIGILNCSFSQTAIQAWVPRVGFADATDDYTKAIYQKILETDPTTPEHKAAWSQFYQDLETAMKENDARIKRGEPALDVAAKTPGNLSGNRDASWMYNGRLHPVVPYAIRGAIWNQGYANMGEGLPYYNNLHSMVRGWRKVWDKPELPVYFHQFYTPGRVDPSVNHPEIGGTAEMRLGTWLARDIPYTGMASQIDIMGAIHYSNKVIPGRRLALHALKNQYPSVKLKEGGKASNLVVDGPMFKAYTVKGNKLIVSFEHAKGGLVVASTSGFSGTKIAMPEMIEDGEKQVTLFSVADENRVWHPAQVAIDGETVVLSSPDVSSPRGVAYGTGGVGGQPSLYNRALLPMTPFIYYDNELVTAATWPDDPIKIAGVVPDPSAGGLLYEYRKMPLLSTQFRDNAVLQAGVPVPIWGSAIHDWGYEAKGEGVIHFSFAPGAGSGLAPLEKTIPVTPGMQEWMVTVPPMKPTAEPGTLKVRFTIDGELAHESVRTNVVIGDVWYVGAPSMKLALPAVQPSGKVVRVMTRKAKGSVNSRPRRFSVCVSTTPLNRFASLWSDATSGLAAVLGHRLAATTGNPVGIILMESETSHPPLKGWISQECLNLAPSLMDDYKTVGAQYPGNPYYNANIERYIADWKAYWGSYIPAMMATKAVPNGVAWGSYPDLTSAEAGNSEATMTYNVLVHSFTPAALKGILFLANPTMVEADQGANFGPELSALVTCWKQRFGGDDLPFVYTIPDKALAPGITVPEGIKGASTGVEIQDWTQVDAVIEAALGQSR